MKVLVLSSSESIHTQRWVNSLVEKGVDVVLVSQHLPIGMFDSRVKYYQLKDFGDAGYFLHTFRVRSIIRSEDPDIVHAHFASGYGTLAKNSSRNYFLSVWGSDVYEFPDSSRIKKYLLKRVLAGANRIFSTSYVMRERTRQFTDKNIEVIPFGVDCERFNVVAKPRAGIKIGLVKVLSEKYGVDILLKAFAIVISERPANNILLEIAGDGELKADLERLSADLGVASKVSFIGWVDNSDVPEFIAGLDIFVVPSRWDSESFGVVAVEAGAASKPCVVSNVGGLPEVVQDGVTGYVVPKEDPKLLAEKIISLIDDDELRRVIGDAGRKRVLENYNWNDNVDTMCQYYFAGYEGV